MLAIIQPAYVYQVGFRSNLVLCGFKEGRPQWLGNDKDFKEFEEKKEKIENLLLFRDCAECASPIVDNDDGFNN